MVQHQWQREWLLPLLRCTYRATLEVQLQPMKRYFHFIKKILLITVVFLLLLLGAVTATTIMAQDDIHPDNWTTTAYDIAAIALVLLSYIAVLVRTSRKFLKDNARERV